MTAKGVRAAFGPVEAYAYHDYPSRPWASPLYAGVWIGDRNAEVLLSPESPLRPFSGDY
jgi:hypothetical protein